MEEKLTVLNVNFLNGSAFRGLAADHAVRYREIEPHLGARSLLERECDLALIPIAEFINYGEYQAFPYGIVANGRVDSVFLFADVPLTELKTIYLDERSRTSVILLKILLSSRIALDQIRFERRDIREIPNLIGGDCGGLIIGDLALKLRSLFAYRYDLAELWHQQTSLPFVFAIWAARKDTLSKGSIEHLKALFPAAIAASEIYARDWAEKHRLPREDAVRYVEESILVEINERALKGAELFWSEGARLGYFPAKRRDVELSWVLENDAPSSTSSPKDEMDLVSIADVCADGSRISIAEGCHLSNQLTVAELGFIASQAAIKHTTENIELAPVELSFKLTNVCEIRHPICSDFVPSGSPYSVEFDSMSILTKIGELPFNQPLTVKLLSGITPTISLEWLEKVFRQLKERANTSICALSAEEVERFARDYGISVTAVLARLRANGLDLLGAPIAPLLLKRDRPGGRGAWITPERWIEIHRLSHALGLRSIGYLTISRRDTMEDRLIHLDRLRALQDETGGFAGITIEVLSECCISPALDLFRSQALARIFLDNIPAIEVSSRHCGTPFTEALLQFGADTAEHLMEPF